MEINELLPAKSKTELRYWFQEHGLTEKSCWVVVNMKLTQGTLLYLDAVEEALCFGWIDGIKKKISETELAQRLSPRSQKSSWTELNKERARRLEALGLMTEAGRKVLPDLSYESFKIDPIIELRLKEETDIYQNFVQFPDLYKRVRIDTIQSNKNQPEVFKKRLDKFITNTKQNKMYGNWDDNGRLLNYETEYLKPIGNADFCGE
ncbi:YdeI/OmpD-associated family protein [Paenibacillus albidus]|uniref:YdeI/OmpD-associated family protein n=1 Tax=Paenibacillus albidus TaxID=2041023 RepID=UPI001BE52F24|nr:YdeI/OmpD-associated family protein [Paenibacillus albidus]MBT2288040.1 YdeI/OmpD-associated family protein [Paenibacillus albidus]